MQELPRSPAAERNREPILEVLRRFLPKQTEGSDECRVLEIASGSGQHVEHFASALPHIYWQPSDPDVPSREALRARIARSGLTNVAQPLALDVLDDWPLLTVEAVIVANMLHISAADTLLGLCRGAAGACCDGGLLHIYGPFKQNGKHTSQSNVDFDASLRARDPSWGIRDLEDVLAVAAEYGFAPLEQIAMPANNFSLLFQYHAGAG